MVWLTLLVAVVNLGLGFAVAACLGLGPPGPRAAWEALLGYGRQSELSTDQLLAQLASSPADLMLDDELDHSIDDLLSVEDYGETVEEEASGQLPLDGPEAWNLDEKFVEMSLLKLNIAMMKSGQRATDIDTQLRACKGHTDADTVQRCLAQLKEDCETYLAEHSELAERFGRRIGELGELQALGEEIEVANLEQAAQVETTLNNLKHMDFESDLEQANHRLLEEIGNLRVARHKLRDSQEVAFLAIARQENRIEKIESRLFNDPLTKLYNRIGIEATLWKWWKEKRHQSRQLNTILFDIDSFGRVNEHHGPAMGDRIVQQLAEIIRSQVGKTDLVGRCSGQRFIVVMLDLGPRAAMKTAETVRQTIAQTEFIIGRANQPDATVRVTVGTAIVEISPEDALEAVLDRLEKTLRQAKQAGPNQAFSNDGKTIVPVTAPDLKVPPQEIRI